jgi:predicted dehydrogenase
MIYNVALIGYGYWGPKLARNIHNSSIFNLKFIVDSSQKNLNKAKSEFPLSILLKSYHKIKKDSIDLVVISTPTKTHFLMANYFLKFSNVLIEKPLSLNLKDAVALEKVAKINKKMLFVDYPFIFSGSINYIKKVIQSKKYGKLNEIETFREQAPIRTDADVVWDLGVHDISIFKYLLNSNPKKITSLKYNTIKTIKKDTAYINLHYGNGLKIFVKNSWISPIKIRLIKFKFDNAIIFCDENEPMYKLKIYTRSKNNKNNYKLEIPEIDLSEPLSNLIAYIGKCLKKKQNPIFKNNLNVEITKILQKI